MATKSAKKATKKRAASKPARKTTKTRKKTASKSTGSLAQYKKKRDFRRTPEPAGKVHRDEKQPLFVVQKHDASHLHYDFRLELDGVLKSWAVPKGLSLDPADKRLAIHVEDHPLEYGDFEGTIPKGEYGGGTVMLWDRGVWTPLEDPHEGYRNGKLKFKLDGEKLHGGWMLVRKGGSHAPPDEKTWFLIKERDEWARPSDEFQVTEAFPLSVKTGRDLDEIAAGAPPKPASKRRVKAQAQPSGNGRHPAPAKQGKKSRLPRSIAPELATLVKAAPDGANWLHEIKFDGYRMICRLNEGQVRCFSRNGQDWTDRLGPLPAAIAKLKAKQAILDGEVVVLESGGTTSFQALQNAIHDRQNQNLIYYVFELLYLDGLDLTSLPLVERKRLLAKLVPETTRGPVRFVEYIEGHGPEFFRQACGMGLEGIISKRGDSPYRSGRTEEWLKTKCVQRQEFTICGYTEPSGLRTGLGALLLCYYNPQGELVYAGRVGTGFSEKTLEELQARLKKLERKQTPLDKKPAGSLGRGVHWVEPKLVAQVEFSNWTRDGLLRHPSFQGLREDKKPDEVVLEVPLDASGSGDMPHNGKAAKKRRSSATAARGSRSTTSKASRPKSAAAESDNNGGNVVAGVRITHPERVLYPEQGITKLEVANYYDTVADWMLPHVEHRPLSLVRCPEGRQGQCFFQKHAFAGLPDAVGRVEIREKNKTATYLVVDNVQGLVSLVQFGVLEFHLWGCRTDDVERPDRLVFDLDPGPAVDWKALSAAAIEMRDALDALGLRSFLKTTGGKGLHVVVPIRRQAEWEEVKAFCRAVAERVAAAAPQRYTTNMAKAARQGKIFIDYLRNERGATWVAPYSTRARAGAPVSTPLAWDELKPGMRSDYYTIVNLPARLASLKRDPWAELSQVRQSLTAKMKKAAGV